MRLYLVDDLPLFGVIDDRPDHELIIREEISRLASRIPASVTYLGFHEIERFWASNVGPPCDALVLVGSRPRLLACRSGLRNTLPLVLAYTRRTLSPQGHTESVTVTLDDAAGLPDEAGTLRIIDDVVMSGTTIRAVLAALGQHGSQGARSVRVLMATARSLERVRASFPTADIRTETVLHFEPIDQGTVIFLRDLLYGTLRGQPFLSQTGLLRPFFGDDLSALHRLRRVLSSAPTADLESDDRCCYGDVQ